MLLRALFSVFLSISLISGAQAVSRAEGMEASPGWKLVWNDEFDGAAVDASKWRIEDRFINKNGELQYYSAEDVYLENGKLVLRSQERIHFGKKYTSGLVETKGRFATKYGRIEVRAKLPKGQGIWPAHWMLPADGSWPPEIDIMELLGHEPTKVYMTLHWEAMGKQKFVQGSVEGPDFSADFHVFAAEWEPGRIRWTVDGEECYVAEKNVPDKLFYIILNTAVGGYWPGRPDASTEFPQYHVIDYVRVYDKL